MKPIPLRAPDRRIYAYACGVCHHPWSSGHAVWAKTGPDRRGVEQSRLDAEECCTCHTCGEGPVVNLFLTCEACWTWQGFCALWPRLADAIGHVDRSLVECEARERVDAEED